MRGPRAPPSAVLGMQAQSLLKNFPADSPQAVLPSQASARSLCVAVMHCRSSGSPRLRCRSSGSSLWRAAAALNSSLVEVPTGGGRPNRSSAASCQPQPWGAILCSQACPRTERPGSRAKAARYRYRMPKTKIQAQLLLISAHLLPSCASRK